MTRSTPVAVALVVLLVPSALQGQTRETFVSDMRIAADAGIMFDSARPFSRDLHFCIDETTYFVGGTLGYDFSSYIGLEGSWSLHAENAEGCVNGLVPPDVTGTLTSREFAEGIEGYPHTTARARLVVRSPRVLGLVAGRLYGGGGWIIPKDIGLRLAGFGIRVGSDRMTVHLDAESWWFELPFTDVERTYRDGELISTTRTSGETREDPLLIRAGVGWSL